MSDDGNGFSFEDEVSRAYEVRDFLDKPDINQYLYDYETEWLTVWNISPVEDMSPGQIDAMINIIMDQESIDWNELYDSLNEDFWEWFRENYSVG